MKRFPFVVLAIIIAISSLTNSCQKSMDNSADITALKASVAALQKRTDSLAAALAATNNNLNNLADSVNSIKNKLTVIAGQISQLEIQITAVNANISAINSQLAVLNQEYADLLSKLNAILAQLAVPPPTLLNGLVAYYPFSGNSNDISGNGNNGVVNGAILTNDRFGNSNNAYYFNGNSYISVPHSTSLNVGASMSISLWLKYNTLGNTTNMVLQKGTGKGCQTTGYYIAFDNGYGTLPFVKGLGYGQSNPTCGGIADTSYINSEWHNIVIIYYPPTGNKIYFDGQQQVGNWSSCPSCTILNSTNPLIIGGSIFLNGLDGISWNGILDDIRIYNRTLSTSEVQYLFLH